jgi:phosphate:Na+ symporter
MFELLDEWKFLAGLGIFLFGMFMMEESIKLLSGRSFKTMIRRYTGTRLKGLITGIVSTSILQSSSAVSLMVLAFVGAGLMTLVNAIAVIMGAKVGTTITAWIVAIFGFKFKIDTFALPMIGLGGLGLIFLAKSPRYVNISKLMASLGFLFHGLDFMKTSVEELAVAIDLSMLPALGLWVYVVVGILLTAIMQSSSATIAIILTTLFAGVIDFRAGAAMVIGANVGTTVTILLGSIGGIPAKKQAAISSLVFNIGTAAVVLMILPVIFWLVLDLFEFSDNVVLGVALFHTIFNVTGVLVFFPLIPILAVYLERFCPEKRTVLAQYIVNTTPEVTEAAIVALRKEILNQLYLSIDYIAPRYQIEQKQESGKTGYGNNHFKPEEVVTYEDLGRLHAEIFAFYARLQAYELNEHEAMHIELLMRSTRSIMNATKNFYEILPEIDDIGNDEKPFMIEAFQNFKDRLKDLRTIVEKVTAQPDDANMTELLKQFFISVEEADKNFIRSCSKSVTRGIIREKEVTRLLMANRLFTQSSRMLVLSMQGLTRNFNRSEETLQNNIAGMVRL